MHDRIGQSAIIRSDGGDDDLHGWRVSDVGSQKTKRCETTINGVLSTAPYVECNRDPRLIDSLGIAIRTRPQNRHNRRNRTALGGWKLPLGCRQRRFLKARHCAIISIPALTQAMTDSRTNGLGAEQRPSRRATTTAVASTRCWTAFISSRWRRSPAGTAARAELPPSRRATERAAAAAGRNRRQVRWLGADRAGLARRCRPDRRRSRSADPQDAQRPRRSDRPLPFRTSQAAVSDHRSAVALDEARSAGRAQRRGRR